MKDLGEQLEQELIGRWDSSKPLPDRIYFLKVFKRSWRFLALGFGITVVLAWLLPQTMDNTYKSSVYAIFDHVDVSGSGLGTSPQVGYNTVARLFKARFESPDFLYEIVNRLGGKNVFVKEGPVSSWISSSFLGKLKQAAPKPSTIDEDKILISRILSKQIDAFPEPESGMLVLNTYSDSPKLAQELANESMELFIRRELEEQIKGLDIKLNFLQKNVVRAPDASRRVATTPRIGNAQRVENLKNEDKARELEDRLRTLNSQLDTVRLEREQSMTGIKRELVRLQTTLQPNHPSVVEKRKEIDLMRSQSQANEENLLSEIDRARRQLWSQRSNTSSPDVGEAVMRSPETYQGAFFVAVADRIKDIELERKNLQRQAEEPSLRTRIRILFPASFEPVPFKNQRRNFGFVILLGGLGLCLFGVLYREFANKKARDAWRIERSTGKALVAQISHQSANEFANISPRLADQLRTHLSKITRVDEAARTLLSYRRLELAMLNSCRGRAILLVNAGPFDETAQVVKNYLNIYATDHQDDFLLIDCNLQDPVYKRMSKDGPDLVDFLEGRAKFEDVVVNRQDLDGFAFDVLPPMVKFSGEKTRSFREDTIQKVLEKVPKKYKQIFIRSMPESHFIENMALLHASSDAYIFIDANRTTYFDLHRTLTHLQSDKIRGLVALGT